MPAKWWVLTLGFAWLLNSPADGAEPIAATPVGLHRIDVLCGPACSSPPGYAMPPHSCEVRHSCCENAWAGYCEEVARHNAWWTHFGTGHKCHQACSQCAEGVVEVKRTASPTVQPAPVIPEAPVPQPVAPIPPPPTLPAN